MYCVPSTMNDVGVADDAGVGRELPQHVPVPGVVRAKHPIVGAAAEHQPAARGEHRAPVGGFREPVRPHSLAGIDVPRLHFADMLGARSEKKLESSRR